MNKSVKREFSWTPARPRAGNAPSASVVAPAKALAGTAHRQINRVFLGCLAASLFAWTLTAQALTTPAASQTKAKVQAQVQVHPEPAPADPVAQIYAESNQTLLWSAYGQPKELAYEALEALQRGVEHGLHPERYAVETLYSLLQNIQTDKQLKQFDEALTSAVWSFNEDLRVGHAHEKARYRKRVRRKSQNPAPEPADADAVAALVAAITSGDLRTHLESLPPTFAAYKQLQSVLDTYTDFHLLGGWEPLPEDMFLKPGDTHPKLSALRYRLIMTDGLHETDAGSNKYDEAVQAAILRFQTRHGLAADGEIGPATLKTLNITAAEKVRRIGLNLARLRQLPKTLPDDHIAVNIPEFKLRLIRDKKEALSMGVVVGSRRTPTPAMRDEMRHLVFNPYWYPPRGITVREILPKLRRDPSYLERTGFELLHGKTVIDPKLVKWKELPARNFPFRLRQVPGEKNSLGEVKFIFPNKKAIYLHDTPARKLFGERVRAFSHGCVRLEKPRELASALMNWDRGWSEEDVVADIEKAKRKLRKFKERMAIYLVYQTATVENSVVNFHPDIYHHDRLTKNDDLLAPLVAAVLNKAPNNDNINNDNKKAKSPDIERVATR